MVDLLSDGVHVCRKSRTCDQCNSLIQVGQRYRRQVYTDGGLQTYRAHEDCDQAITEYMDIAGYHWPDDLAILTADHGCDPTTPSTDHSREYTPLLVFGPHARAGVNLGLRATLSDIGQTVAKNFGTSIEKGTSFLGDIT